MLPGVCLGSKVHAKVAKQTFKSIFAGCQPGTLSIKARLMVQFSKQRECMQFLLSKLLFCISFFCLFKKNLKGLTSRFILTTLIHLVFRLIYLNLFPCDKQIDLSSQLKKSNMGHHVFLSEI